MTATERLNALATEFPGFDAIIRDYRKAGLNDAEIVARILSFIK